jgi:hypothetical protein
VRKGRAFRPRLRCASSKRREGRGKGREGRRVSLKRGRRWVSRRKEEEEGRGEDKDGRGIKKRPDLVRIVDHVLELVLLHGELGEQSSLKGKAKGEMLSLIGKRSREKRDRRGTHDTAVVIVLDPEKGRDGLADDLLSRRARIDDVEQRHADSLHIRLHDPILCQPFQLFLPHPTRPPLHPSDLLRPSSSADFVGHPVGSKSEGETDVLDVDGVNLEVGGVEELHGLLEELVDVAADDPGEDLRGMREGREAM